MGFRISYIATYMAGLCEEFVIMSRLRRAREESEASEPLVMCLGLALPTLASESGAPGKSIRGLRLPALKDLSQLHAHFLEYLASPRHKRA